MDSNRRYAFPAGKFSLKGKQFLLLTQGFRFRSTKTKTWGLRTAYLQNCLHFKENSETELIRRASSSNRDNNGKKRVKCNVLYYSALLPLMCVYLVIILSTVF